VSELLPELTLAWQNELTITEVGNSYNAHPTLAEAVMEAAEAAENRSIHI
jgi:dihydrolipoamide dehydrogenase